MNEAASVPNGITSWDRAAIVALGAAGCALSYDALQQMATAIHIRGLLTFVFPLVIDGFIAYGVRALLVLRTATLAARCYVWFLFGTATAASIWANALHAVRLNQQQPEGTGLRLGDVTVGVLSTLAPLALAGAVHLYILIARRAGEVELSAVSEDTSVRSDRCAVARTNSVSAPDPIDGGQPTANIVRAAVIQGPETKKAADITLPTAGGQQLGRPQDLPTEPVPEHHGRTADLGGQPDIRTRPVAFSRQAKPLVTGSDTSDRRGAAVTDEGLLALARPAVTEAGRLTRKVVGDAIRSQGHGLSNGRLTELMELLRQEAEVQDNTVTG
ncbi:DUF2637 domain-containing protein [Streptomyces sp. NPDC050264]|uniref:DUF2637 domain-containing protein n=1 Tax=Streptomyces sp. NPDC050264 TaxID=3155038 RepID=UPI0034146322